ncbi:MAG: ABC transporter ATP-binding protein, partial [Thermoleophilia bacterium]|nr:ABC transporter ATP-binding protein [Thermoleophilia bacterium]
MSTDAATPLLDVRDLRVHFPTEDGLVKAVDGATFQLAKGETLGVVGESGSGKSVTFLTVMGLINRKRAIVSGQVLFDGIDLLAIPDRQLRRLRGARIGMVFQDPMTSLHPMHRVGDQIAETVRAHRDVS